MANGSAAALAILAGLHQRHLRARARERNPGAWSANTRG